MKVIPLILVAVATPSVGVISVGELLNTNPPVPVSSEIADAIPDDVLVPVIADVPLPINNPVRVFAPVPPADTSIRPSTLVSYVVVSISPRPEIVCHDGRLLETTNA